MHSVIKGFKKFTRPAGVFVVIVGPDGCGKSTITNEAMSRVKGVFEKTWSFHWRPNLLPKLGRSATKNTADHNSMPSQKSKYSGLISYIRFLYYWLDFVIGYWVIVYPGKVQNSFIIAERYYIDILVHPARYGFSCPGWFFKLFGSMVPKPDMTILLSADPQLIHDRKQELPVDVIAEQISEYKTAIVGWGCDRIIDTSSSIEASSAEFIEAVVKLRTPKRCKTL